MGLPGDGTEGSAPDQSAPSAAKLSRVLACAGAPSDTLFAEVPTTGWTSIHDLSAVPTGAPKDEDALPRALERLERMAGNHALSFDRVEDGQEHLEVLVAVRLDGKTPKVDAIAINAW